MFMKSVIYQITNSVNNKIYIGSAVYFNARKATHLYTLRNGKHRNTHLQNAYNKYGEENFIFTIIEYVDRDLLLEREQHYLDLLIFSKQIKHDDIAYNKNKLATSGFGRIVSDETKRKLSESHKGHKHKEETKAKMRLIHGGSNNHFYGKKHTDETKKRLSDKLKGREISRIAIEKLIKQNSKVIIQLSLDGLFIRTWDSIRLAQKALCISHITDVLHGRRKQVGGYLWIFKNDVGYEVG